jgi:mono/diheme cytochrome c family protein
MRIEDYATPEEQKRLASVFMTVVLAITVLALFDFIVIPSLRIANRPPAGTDIMPRGATGWLDPTDYPPTKGYTVPPVDPKTVMTPTPALLARGKELFSHNCAQCHGDGGRGDGPAGKTLNPGPRNFTQPNAWTNGYGLAAVFKTITLGVPPTGMSGFDYISAKDRIALAHYVQSLGTFPHPESPAALDALAKSFASGGEKVPNKIPVSLAMQKLEEDYVAPKRLALSGLAARAIRDPIRTAEWLRNSAAWRKGPAALASLATAGAPENGFAVSVASLSQNEWSSLFLWCQTLTF